VAVAFIVFGVVVLIAVGWWKLAHRGEQQAPPRPASPTPAAPPLEDLILSAAEVADKARDTRALLERAAQHDPLLSPSHLEEFITATFLPVQECWQKRDYGPVQDLLEPDLLAEHEALLQALRRENVLNRLDGLHVRRLEFVHACSPEDADRQEVTALLTFEARSYYVDERSGYYRGGSHKVSPFQEFWTFRRHGDTWRLHLIERNESARLDTPNYAVEQTAVRL
jgi:predicted lipid-binding transport protein (Tim44 family)